MKKIFIILLLICLFNAFSMFFNNIKKVNAQLLEENINEVSILSTNDLIEIIIQEELDYLNLFSTLKMGVEKFKVNNKYYKELIMRNNFYDLIEQKILLSSSSMEKNNLVLLQKIINDSEFTDDFEQLSIDSKTPANIYTPNGTVVQDAYIMENDVTDTSVASAHTWVLNRYPTITNEDYVAPANSAYNCHSYAFYSQDPLTNNVWINYPYSYLEDFSYVGTEIIRPGDIICYWSYGYSPDGYNSHYISHSAIVYSGTANINYNDALSGVTLISKWAQRGVYKHVFDECPYGPTYDITFSHITAYRPRTNDTYQLSTVTNEITIEKTINSNNILKYGMYELNVEQTSDYLINISSNNPLDIRLYNLHMNLLTLNLIESYDNLYFYTKTLTQGIYYLRVSYANNENVGDILINIKRHEHSYDFSYELIEFGKHRAYCDCGLSIDEYHTLSDSMCIYCGHIHLFSEWKYFNNLSHVESCSCGSVGTVKEAHYIRVEDIGKRKALCLGCLTLLDLNSDMIISPISSSSAIKVSVNGSYILPSGIVVLEEVDVEKYENGTLIFYDKDNVPQIY